MFDAMNRVVAQSFLHVKCRNTDKPYLRSDIFRKFVPDDKVDWKQPFAEYDPPDYTSPSLNGKEWADSSDSAKCAFNAIDGKINRKSYFCKYEIHPNGRPLNPFGRTGICGRGTLGRWGPNHAADPIVSRLVDGKLQFVGIQRKDTGEWAIPGGMVDAGEHYQETLVREFTEEALNDGGESSKKLANFWGCGKELYKGYVDDPRNTDNSWMETVVMNYHDSNDVFRHIQPKAGDDATNVRWITVERDVPLYASHEYFIKLLLKFHGIML